MEQLPENQYMDSYLLFRLDKQKWTRQGASSGAARVSFAVKMMAAESTLHHALALVWLTIVVIFFAQI